MVLKWSKDPRGTGVRPEPPALEIQISSARVHPSSVSVPTHAKMGRGLRRLERSLRKSQETRGPEQPAAFVVPNEEVRPVGFHELERQRRGRLATRAMRFVS